MRHHFLAVSFLALSLAACVSGSDDVDDTSTESLELCAPDVLDHPDIDTIVLSGADTLEQQSPTTIEPRSAEPHYGDPAALVATADVIDEPGPGACACESDGCVVNWVSENVGCNVCVHIMCEGGDIGVCNPCLEQGEPIADRACAIPEPGSLGE